LELLGVVWSLNHAKVYTTGNNLVEVLTDHSALESLSKKDLGDIENPRLIRLLEKISHYNYRIRYIKGKTNQIADCLSRLQIEDLEEEAPGMEDVPRNLEAKRVVKRVNTRSTALSTPLDIMDIAKTGMESPSYATMKSWIRGEGEINWNHEHLQEVKHAKDELSIEETPAGEVIYIQRSKVGQVILPPKEARPELLRLAHSAHIGPQRMWATCSRLWWWPTIHRDIQKTYDQCTPCKTYKRSKLESKKVAPLICTHMVQVTIGHWTICNTMGRTTSWGWIE
jgi:hypothetical protein